MFQSTHIMTDDGGIDIKHHKTIHVLTDSALPHKNDYNTPLMQMECKQVQLYCHIWQCIVQHTV